MHSSASSLPRAPRLPRPWLPFVLWALAAALPAQAQTATPPPIPAQAAPDSPWKVSGFGTLGVVSQAGGNDWGLVRNSTQLGASSRLSATPDSRLGLQLDWNPGTRWEAGVQGVLVSRPSGTPIAQSIEWAHLGYRPWDDTRLRFGRTSADDQLPSDTT